MTDLDVQDAANPTTWSIRRSLAVRQSEERAADIVGLSDMPSELAAATGKIERRARPTG